MSKELKTFKFEEEPPNKLHLYLGEELYTTLYYNDFNLANRPFLYPMMAPCGINVLRDYPIKDVEGDAKDHIHHTGIWTAWGKVNGVDNWAFGKNKGIQKVVKKEYLLEGDDAILDLDIEWCTPSGELQLKERRIIKFYNPIATDTLPSGQNGKIKVIDFIIELTPAPGTGRIKFGDTKEGGFLSVRVATPITVKNGGRIQNSEGGISEGEGKERNVWGRRAKWCDYSGIIDGKRVGIAIIDHPSNVNYPTYWHVRNYGLMTANPFGLSFFIGPWRRGTYKLKEGNSLKFKYRVVVHDGDANEVPLNDLTKF